jgi:hypothetical protein
MPVLGRRTFLGVATFALPSPLAAVLRHSARLSPSGGVHDEAAIARAYVEGTRTLSLAAGKWCISAPIEVPSGCTLLGPGARICAADDAKARLRTHGNHVVLADRAVLADLQFEPQRDLSGFTLGQDAAVIMVRGSHTRIYNVSVQAAPLPGGYQPGGLIVAGNVRGNRIEGCIFRRCGLHYSYGAARSTVVMNCLFDHAPGNAITGLCTEPDGVAMGHVVEGNQILCPGRMGIEDYGKLVDPRPRTILGTRISQNTIIASAESRPEFFAISAVGLNSLIEKNHIQNWPRDYCIEVGGGRGAVVHNNTIEWSDGNPYAVVGVQVQGLAYTGRRVEVSGNRIVGASAAMLSRSQDVLFASNTIVDPGRSAADFDRGGRAEITNNLVYVSNPRLLSATARILFNLPGPATMQGNRVTYAAKAIAANGREITIITGGDGSSILDTSIDVTGVEYRGSSIIGFSANGQHPQDIVIGGTRSSGPVIGDYTGMLGLSEITENHWSGGVRGRV